MSPSSSSLSLSKFGSQDSCIKYIPVLGEVSIIYHSSILHTNPLLPMINMNSKHKREKSRCEKSGA
uniref:Uncharacterized protein n=1 Tax=Arion vulgaris TaxID=1028688 RepID=A0A0B6ZAC3_9EUPU